MMTPTPSKSPELSALGAGPTADDEAVVESFLRALEAAAIITPAVADAATTTTSPGTAAVMPPPRMMMWPGGSPPALEVPALSSSNQAQMQALDPALAFGVLPHHNNSSEYPLDGGSLSASPEQEPIASPSMSSLLSTPSTPALMANYFHTGSGDNVATIKGEPMLAQMQPAATLRQIRTTSRRAAKESVERDFTIACTQCIRLLTSSKMYGNASDIAGKIIATDLLCPQCLDTVETARREASGATQIECRICHIKAGLGWISIQALSNDGSALNSLTSDVAMEHICSDCASKYKFCTSCGGGSAAKPGKYRPRQMFAPKRKTCQLPHSNRIGSPAHHRYVSYIIPVNTVANVLTNQNAMDLQPRLLLGDPFPDQQALPYSGPLDRAVRAIARDLVNHSHLFNLNFFDASAMQDYPTISNWEQVTRRRNEMAREVNHFINGSFRDAATAQLYQNCQIRRYVVILFYPHVRSASKTGAAAAVQLQPATNLYESTGPEGWLIGGCVLSSWNVTTRTVCTDYCLFSGQPNVGSNSALINILTMNGRRIREDVQANPDLPPPLHAKVVTLPMSRRKESMAKVLNMMYAMGFRQAKTYVEEGGVDANSLGDSGVLEDIEAHEVFMKRWNYMTPSASKSK